MKANKTQHPAPKRQRFAWPALLSLVLMFGAGLTQQAAAQSCGENQLYFDGECRHKMWYIKNLVLEDHTFLFVLGEEREERGEAIIIAMTSPENETVLYYLVDDYNDKTYVDVPRLGGYKIFARSTQALSFTQDDKPVYNAVLEAPKLRLLQRLNPRINPGPIDHGTAAGFEWDELYRADLVVEEISDDGNSVSGTLCETGEECQTVGLSVSYSSGEPGAESCNDVTAEVINKVCGLAFTAQQVYIGLQGAYFAFLAAETPPLAALILGGTKILYDASNDVEKLVCDEEAIKKILDKMYPCASTGTVPDSGGPLFPPNGGRTCNPFPDDKVYNCTFMKTTEVYTYSERTGECCGSSASYNCQGTLDDKGECIPDDTCFPDTYISCSTSFTREECLKLNEEER